MNNFFIKNLSIFLFIIAGGIAWKYFTLPMQEGTLDKKNELIIGTNTSFPPYELVDDSGEIVGYDIDVASEIAKKLNKKPIIKDMGFDSLVIALKQGKIDLIMAGISITQEKLKEIAMIPYCHEKGEVLALLFWNEIPDGVNTINDIALLSNKKVCTQVGSIFEKYLEKKPEIEMKTLDEITDLIMDIKYGKSTAALLQPEVAYSLQSKFPQIKIQIVPLAPEEQSEGDGIGIKKENHELIEKVKNIIDELKESGTLQNIYKKWWGKKGEVT